MSGWQGLGAVALVAKVFPGPDTSPGEQLCKPAWVDVQLAAVDVPMVRRSSISGGSPPDGPEPYRTAGYRMRVTAETVSRLCQQEQLSEGVVALGILVQRECSISRSVFYSVLKKCVVQRDLILGRRVHALSVKSGFESDTFLCNHILRMYASHASMQEAMDVFTMVAEPDAFMWSSIISAHVKLGQDKQAIQLYRCMRTSSVKPDGHVFVAALQACARGVDLKTGQQVHTDVLASGVDLDLFVCNCLVDMYAKCGSLEDAQRVFDGLVKKNVVTWNALIAGYSQQDRGQEALCLYRAMQEEGSATPDTVTFVSLLQACASVGTLALETGKQLHTQIKDRGLHTDVFVGSSLVNMYAKCGSLEDAQSVFDGLAEKNVVTWNAMIAGYSQQGKGEKALYLYTAMQEGGITMHTSVTFVCILQACASVGTQALEKGKQLHQQITKEGFQVDAVVGCSLVNMYAKCGSLEDAQSVFDGLDQKNVVTWNAMIAGYSQQGMGQEALHLYRTMQEESNAAPDSVTFVCLLQACANVAALHLGEGLHAQIAEQGLHCDVLVAISLINMYTKSGSMVNARQVFESLPERCVVSWNVLIGGYTCHGDSEVVFDLFHRMREDGIQPDGITFLSILTVCSHAGLVKQGREYFEAMSKQYCISPTAEHYTCMVDLLGRAGQMDYALGLVRTMPIAPDAAVWHTLLGACRKWGNVEVGRLAFAGAMELDTQDAPAYVLMSNIYTGSRMWEQAQDLQGMRRRRGAWKQAGQSWWADTDGLVHSFLVWDENCTQCRLKS